MSEQIYSRTYAPKEDIVRIGDPGKHAYYIERGKVEVTVPRNGDLEILATMGKGEIFGEMSIIDDAPRSATVTAVEETEVIVIELSRHLQSLSSKNPMMNLILRIVLSRLREANLQVAGSLSSPPQEDISMEKIRSIAIEKIGLEKEMREGLDANEFEMHYQPIISLSNNKVAGFEALIRWRKDGEFIGPGKFIPLAEETGLIVEQGRFALKTALADHATFIELTGETKPFMSVNLSGLQIVESDEIKNISDIIRESRINPEQIKLEVTETLMLDDFSRAQKALQQLKELGVSIAIDDFGTGYSSLSYLHQLPLDTLKIDRAFVNDMNKSPKSMQVVESIISLSAALEMNIVAEGIEEEEQINILRKLGCHYGQGFYMSRPLPADQILVFLQS